MTDELNDKAKKDRDICPNCGKERSAANQEATSLEGVCPRCGAPRGKDGAGRSCSCSTTGGG